MPVDRTNLALLLSKLPAGSLAQRLVAPFEQPTETARKAAEAVLATVKEAHLKEGGDGTTEEA